MMLSVVAGHIANFPFGEVFYYYQVAGFFLLSGYFFHYDKYADRFSKFLKSRSKLICQYLIYSAIIISTHNLLTEFGLQPTNYIYYSPADYVTAFIRSITIPSEALAGAMWFIPVLILMQFVFYWLNRVVKENKLLVTMIDKLVLTVTPIFSIPPRGAAAVEIWMYQVARRTKTTKQNRLY